MNIIFELSSKALGNGRRPVKLILHEIYPDNTEWNINGISWIEGYVLKNLDSIKDMSIRAEFIDESRAEPYGHGLTEIRDNTLPIFEDATVVGHCTHAYIDTMVIEEVEKRVCIAEGTLDEMCYPKFIKWLEEQIETEGVNGSVEIIGLSVNDNKIVYEDGWKEKGRVPVDYIYSGYAILGAMRGSDATAVVVELNSKKPAEQGQAQPVPAEQEFREKELKEDCFVDEKLMADIQVIKEQVLGLNNLESKVSEINELTVTSAEKDKEIAILKELLEKAKEERKEIDEKYDEAWTKIHTLEKMIAEQQIELAKSQIAEKVAEMNEALKPFSDEQKAVAQTEIDAFTADPASVEINTIVGIICTDIFARQKENEAAQAASATHEENTVNDIFAPMSVLDGDDKGKDDGEDDGDIY